MNSYDFFHKDVDLLELLRKIYVKTKKICIKYENHLYIFLVVLSVTGYFAIYYADALIKGGRWDLYQHIAMADRFLNGKGFYYSAEEASTPYFPGVGFLAVVVGFLCGNIRDHVLLAIASIIGAIFLGVLVRISFLFSKNKWVSLFSVCFLLFNHFNYYKYYMNEFKADTLVYLFAFVLICLIHMYFNDIVENHKVFFYISVFLVSFMMDITKQQALYVDIALGIYIVFNKKSISKKIKLLIPMVMAGVVDIIVIFSIPGMKLLAIENLKKMPYWDSEHIFNEIINVYNEHEAVVWLTLLSFIIGYILKEKIDDRIYMWLFISIIVLAAQIAGGMKIGGNIGNYQAGLVLFVPFMSFGICKILKFFIDKNKKWIICLLIIVFFLPKLVDMNYSGFKRCIDFFHASPSNQESIEYLKKNYSGEKCMYDSDHYMMICRSEMIPMLDIYSVPIYGENYYDIIKNSILNKDYNVIVVDINDLNDIDETLQKYFDHYSGTSEALLNNYVLDENEDIPLDLKGKVYVLPQ